MTQKRGNALLAELMVVALFFALAAMVLAQVFAAADEQSRRAETLDEALAAYNAMRTVEGGKLREDIAGRADTIEAVVGRVEERSPQTVAAYREKLLARMQEGGDGA